MPGFQDIWSWNEVVPTAANVCVHEVIAETAHRQPDAPAICAWDGEFTYTQLDRLSTQLAHYLVDVGIGPNIIVPVCFEKSMWTPVAMLAVMKAGGASVAIDAKQPEERLRAIIQQVQPKIVLCSATNEALVSRVLGSRFAFEENNLVVVVSGSTTVNLQLEKWEKQALPAIVQPTNLLYIVFTSGSTGVPKGVMISHQNFASAIKHQATEFGINKTSRVLDSASYAFDIAWQNLLFTLSVGGCLCIPSDHEFQNDLAACLRHYRVSFADLTPSLACTIFPTVAPMLETLAVGGESWTASEFRRFAAIPRVVHGYGPSECTPCSTMANLHEMGFDRSTIGRGKGHCTWVIDDLEDGSSISPFGEIGELWLEGPLVGQGYLNDPEKTANAFIQDPQWLLNGGPGIPGRRGCLYKTGDLVRYDSDGNLIFVGRKDAQVKIRGQRVELDEVEHHLLKLLPTHKNIRTVAEVVSPRNSNAAVLVAFVSIQGFEDSPEEELIAAVATATAGLDQHLAEVVPSYMVPTAYIPINRVPLTATNKTDRRRLRELGNSMSLEQLAELNSSSKGERREPATITEKQLQELWATVLSIKPSQIGKDDSFLRIGGDSIQAMRLVAAAREKGLVLTVAEVFKQPRLGELAKILRPGESVDALSSIAPFSLLRTEINTNETRTLIASLCTINPRQILDIFPCTPLQEGLLAMTAKRPGDYVARFKLVLGENMDMGRIKKACESVVAASPILRTRIVDFPGESLLQVVVDEQLQWADENSTEGNQDAMGLGTRLSRFELAKSNDKSQEEVVWRIHHALYDGWSLPLMLDAIEKAYHGQANLELTPFHNFVSHTLKTDNKAAEQFWTSYFANCEAAMFPALPSPKYTPRSDGELEYSIADLDWPETDSTPSTAIRAAWAVLQAYYTVSDDVVYGVTVTGRQAAVPGVETIAGPTIATIPVRIVLNWDMRVEEFQQQVQQQAIDSTPFEQTGLQRIRKISYEAQEACQFQTLIIIQPEERKSSSSSELSLQNDNFKDKGMFDAFNTYALLLECELHEKGVLLRFSFDSVITPDSQVKRMAQQFETILRQTCAAEERFTKLRDIATMSKQDFHDIWNWNQIVPTAVDMCVHDLIAETTNKQPDAPAICAWDGQFTYAQLNELTSQLALYLIEIGVGPNIIVPLCFERSMWMSVAMLAVIKAGGASVAIDSTQPEERLQAILQQVHPKLVLCSAANEALVSRLAPEGISVVVISASTAAKLQIEDCKHQEILSPTVQPSDLLYVVFTSGSTGVPKGVMISHGNFASAIKYQAPEFGINETSRVLDSASYAFDIAWQNLLFTLSVGGCLCIPSHEQFQNNLAACLREYQISFTDLTPSLACTIFPMTAAPMLETLAIGGESWTASEFWRFASIPRVVHGYGPSECTPCSTIAKLHETGFDRPTIGRGKGNCTWVITESKERGGRITPIGAIGELWLEGPIVGQGYLNDLEKTANAFIQDPKWLLQGGPGISGRRGRLYRTGDLVRYDAEGNLIFVGRKDAQVKIRGQRVELDEVEHHLLRLFPGHSERNVRIVADVISPRNSSNATLVAFISIQGFEDSQKEELEAAVAETTTGLNERLAEAVPSYMIPTAYIPIKRIPLTATNKTDRRKLRDIGSSMTLEQLGALNLSKDERREPVTIAEKQLQQLWATVLNIETKQISKEDSFLRIGGDSIQAMRLVSAAREQGLALTVAEIFKQPRLSELAKVVQPKESIDKLTPVAPFSLIRDEIPLSDFLQSMMKPLSGVQIGNILDIYPVTARQSAFIGRAMLRPPCGCYTFYLDLSSDIELEDLIEACKNMWNDIDILRAIFLQHGKRYWQVITKCSEAPIEIHRNLKDLDTFSKLVFEENLQQPMELGTPYTKFQLLQSSDKTMRMGVRLSHSQYDGMSLELLVDALSFQLTGKPKRSAPQFSAHIRRIELEQDATIEYWRNFLKGSQPLILIDEHWFSQDATRSGFVRKSFTVTESFAISAADYGDATQASIFVAACACVLAKIADVKDVIFGLIVSGRTTAIPEMEDVFGPCHNIVPIRVKMENGISFTEVVKSVHQQRLASTNYEISSFKNIIEHCVDWPTQLRKYNCIAQFENIDDPSISVSGTTSQLMTFESNELTNGPEVYIFAKPVQGHWILSATGFVNLYERAYFTKILRDIAAVVSGHGAELSESAKLQ